MKYRKGFTLTDAIGLLVIVLVLTIVLVLHALPTRRHGYTHNRAWSTANVRSIVQSMMIYANDHRSFPIAGEATPKGKAQGFRGDELNGRSDVSPSDPALKDNMTASFWILVRVGYCNPKLFINPVTDDTKAIPAVPLNETWDFAARENLSYSPINMYASPASSRNEAGSIHRYWGDRVPGDFVLIGDNNNADGSNVHTMTKRTPGEQVYNLENSGNHDREGQSFGFGDGHSSWENDPFYGPGDRNVYAALNTSGQAVPPSLEHKAEEFSKNSTQTALIPLSGNNGVSLSGLPGTTKQYVERKHPPNYSLFLSLGGAILCILTLVLAVRAYLNRYTVAG